MHQVEGAVALARHLYRPDDLALDRKAAAAAVVALWDRPTGMRRQYTAKRWSAAEDDIARSERPTAEIAQELGRTYQSVNLRRMRLRAAEST